MRGKTKLVSLAAALTCLVANAGSVKAQNNPHHPNLIELFICTPSGVRDGIANFVTVHGHLAMNLFTPINGASLVGGQITGLNENFNSLNVTWEGSDSCNGPFIVINGSVNGVATTLYAEPNQGNQGPINETFNLSNFTYIDNCPFNGSSFKLKNLYFVTYASSDAVYDSYSYKISLNGQPVGFNLHHRLPSYCPPPVPETILTPPDCGGATCY